MVGKQGELLPPTPSSYSFSTDLAIGKPSPSSYTFRDKIFEQAMSLVNDDKNSTSNMLLANDTYTLLEILGIYFKYIEDMKCRINNNSIKLSLASTNRLKILKYFNIHNEYMKSPLKMNN